VIGQISYLIYIKWLEDTDDNRRRRAVAAGLPYTSIFEGTFSIGATPVPLQQMRWSYLRQMTNKEEMLEHVASTVFAWLKTLPPAEYPFSRQMSDAVFLIPNPLLLDEAIRLLDGIAMEIEAQLKAVPDLQDTLGDVYKYLLHDISASPSDSLPTVPGHILDLVCEIASPTIHDVICDPACGMGDMLVCAGEYILKQHTNPSFLYTDENGFEKGARGDMINDEGLRRRFERDVFTGYEKDTAQLGLAIMNLMLHGVDRPLISNTDVLFPHPYAAEKTPSHFTLTLTNLLMGMSTLLSLAGPLRKFSREDVLYIDKIIEMLVTGGRAAMIVKFDLLSARGGEYRGLKEHLFETCEVQGVIRFPPGVFPPSVNDSGALLIIRKKPAPEKAAAGSKQKVPERVWFYDMVSDGYSPDGQRIKLDTNPLPGIALAFHQRNAKKTAKETSAAGQGFFVPLKKIIAQGYSLDIEQYRDLQTAPDEEAASSHAAPKGPAATIAPPASEPATGLPDKFMPPQEGENITIIHKFIRTYYKNEPFTFRQLQTDCSRTDIAMGYEQLHGQVWEMLKAGDPVLKQVYFDPHMAKTYPDAYQFLRGKKAENGIYLLYTGQTNIDTK